MAPFFAQKPHFYSPSPESPVRSPRPRRSLAGKHRVIHPLGLLSMVGFLILGATPSLSAQTNDTLSSSTNTGQAGSEQAPSSQPATANPTLTPALPKETAPSNSPLLPDPGPTSKEPISDSSVPGPTPEMESIPEMEDEGADLQHPTKHPVETTADSMDFDQANHMVMGRGNVVVKYEGVTLLADKATVNTETKQAHAEGHVRLLSKNKEWTSEALDYNFETGAIRAGKAKAQIGNQIYLEGQSMEGADKKNFILRDSYLTTSDYENPEWRLRCKTIVVYPGEKVSLRHLVLYAGDVPLFYIPYMVVPLGDREISSGTQVQVGRKSRWGFFDLNSYTTLLSPDVRPTYHFDYRAERGVGGGIDLRYKANGSTANGNGSETEDLYPRVNGKIKTYYTYDEKMARSGPVQAFTSTSATTQKIAPQRYEGRITQRADLTEDIYSKISVDKLSDVNFQEDYFWREFQNNPQPDNFAEITKWSPNATLSLMGRPRVNNFYDTTERLPEARFDLNRQSIFGTPLFYEGQNSVDRLYKDYAKGTPSPQDYHATRVDTFHQVLYPKEYFGWLNVTPRMGGRATYYDRTLDRPNTPDDVRVVWNTGLEAGYKATRTWDDVKDKNWEIDGLRHIIEPSVNYAFVAHPTRRPQDLPQFDTNHSSYFGIDENLAPLDFPQYTGIDSIDKTSIFRPAIRQRLQTKRDKAPWDLADLLIYQDISVDKSTGLPTFSDLFTEFSTKPLRWLSLGWAGRYNYDRNQFNQSTSSLTFFHDKDWEVSLSHSYFRALTTLDNTTTPTTPSVLGVGFRWALNEDWAIRTTHSMDTSNQTLLEQNYSLDRDLHSWILSLNVSEIRPLNQPSDLRVWVAMTLKAFPEVSLDSRSAGGAPAAAH